MRDQHTVLTHHPSTVAITFGALLPSLHCDRSGLVVHLGRREVAGRGSAAHHGAGAVTGVVGTMTGEGTGTMTGGMTGAAGVGGTELFQFLLPPNGSVEGLIAVRWTWVLAAMVVLWVVACQIAAGRVAAAVLLQCRVGRNCRVW